MRVLSWLEGRSCTNVVRHEYSWQFSFGEGCYLTVWSPWRIVVNGHIIVAHTDHGQKFGGLQPIDVPTRALQVLSARPIKSVIEQPVQGDLSLEFDGGARLELFADSSGYESWELSSPGGDIVVGRND
ncbi:DUF6188 family protein [Thermodesulfobacteriota bacterium]